MNGFAALAVFQSRSGGRAVLARIGALRGFSLLWRSLFGPRPPLQGTVPPSNGTTGRLLPALT